MVYTSIYTQIIPDHDNNFDHTTLWEKSVTIHGIKNKRAKQEKSHPDEVCDQNIVSSGGSFINDKHFKNAKYILLYFDSKTQQGCTSKVYMECYKKG